jgi:hypothetical protein
VLAPYVKRKDEASRPANARGVRIMRYVLPELSYDDGPSGD